ncbi:SacI homology domain-containing protein [Cokeromyces recurvatus]|uniref:SacI homology domain-containing protein n=1 Tax=Cokeromyces recurvatus TaxID=90255 RepID=UPI002220DA9A|nr:SacI homology domain-containing protein [Cokeromyces recurvatus]KAI7900605.1 SacI homology domain-containing protein [Cokeromyces recurvatus]
MQNHLLLREHPRALALRPTVLEEAPSGVLVFKEYQGSETNRAIAELYSPSEFEDSKWRILNSRPVFGCLGLITVQSECFLAIVTDCVSVGRVRAGEEVYKIQSVSFYSLSSSRYDDFIDPTPNWEDDWDQPSNSGSSGNVLHPCAQLQKLFSIGSFYFTPDFDLTRTVQARTSVASMGVHSFDGHFLWNQFLISGLLDFRAKLDRKKQIDLDRGGFLVFAIRGYVGVEEVDIDNERYELSVISKLSCKRAGTRFNSRGIDDNGHVANFVETETILYSDRICYSYTQIRGSVPVFWEQQGMQLVQHKIQISRGPGATQPAVKRHFDELISRYNSVSNVNLLSQRETSTAGETLLSNTYNTAVERLGYSPSIVRMVNFDLHAECRGGNYDNVSILLKDIRHIMDDYGFFLMDTDEIINTQKGIFRTNCMDCLDRTNLVQNEISRRVLLNFLKQTNRVHGIDYLIIRHSHLWAENGDGLSKIYAGTGALKSGFTRTGKVTFMNVLSDATRSVNRFYINNFQDKARQEVIDQLLGKLANQTMIAIHDPISDRVTRQLTKRIKEYSHNRRVTIFAGSYNLNGKSFKGELLNPWLLQHFRWSEEEPDIYVIGFQEIVELSPQQVMATDAEKRKIWEQQIEKTLNTRAGAKSRYTLLRSNQLVGAALIIFVKTDIVDEIRNVESSIKKTGIMGIAGNKGAVAIRMDYGDTSFCFVAAHLASGHSNVDDRNSDFHIINEGLRFLRGKMIDSHDNIIWVSDLNYRISLSNEEVRMYVEEGNIEMLFQNDQLSREMRQGRVFNGYQEGDITFLPTYKYDNGTNTYDTSEKQRIPGWTDRILFKGTQLKQLQYSRAELYTSDHRPVFALFEADILTLDHEAKIKLQKELYQSLSSIEVRTSPPELPKRKNTIRSNSFSSSKLSDSYIDTLIDISVDGEYPPPSTDSKKWWEDGQEIPKADKSRASNHNPFEDDGFVFAGSGNSISKLPSSLQSDSEWMPLSPVSYHGTSFEKQPETKTSPINNVSSYIGFWNNRQ